jgi:uncharacterized protein involved in exopolysaccharide biosynthesis
MSVSRSEDEFIDFQLFFAKVRAKRWWVVGSIIVITAAFVTAAYVMTPIYRASVVLISASSDRKGQNDSLSSALGQFSGLATLAGGALGSADPETEEALAVLKSREFTQRFIDDKNLMPQLFAKSWDAAAGKWKDPRHQPTPARAVKFFDKQVENIVRDKKTNLITLNVDWKDRFEAVAWANELVTRLNNEMRNRAIAKSDLSVKYLTNEFATTPEVETRAAISRLIEIEIKDRMIANVTQEYSFRVVDKAMPPDKDDPLVPQKMVLFIMGPVVGLLIGIALAAVFPPPADFRR